ncbi:MAG: CRISPR system precrRNA processing endoribonuclease RAMP protein Cas6 [Candidatus Heimdallarchaeaceae archaeon]
MNSKVETIIKEKDKHFNMEKLQIPGGEIFLNLVAEGEEIFPTFTGAILRAAILNFINENDCLLSEILHKGNEIRPYSIVPLEINHKRKFKTKRNEICIQKGEEISFAIRILKTELLEGITRLFIHSKAPKIRLFNKEYTLSSMIYKNFSEIKFEYTNRLKVNFLTPTYFSIKQKSESMLFPDSRYFYMNILKIWNKLNSNLFTISEDLLYDWVSKNIVINDYSTYTKRVYICKKTPIKGFQGWVVYRFKNGNVDPFIYFLTEFGKYSGVGGNRTAGMGNISIKWLKD